MKIKDLPQEIKELAFLRGNEDSIESSLSKLFDWEDSVEGHIFWEKIYDGDFSVYYEKYGYPNDKPKEEINTPKHYNNEKGTLYKVAMERGWNPYLFEIVKRVERAERKGKFISDIEKSINVLKLYLEEQGHRFKDQIEPLNK